MSPAVEPLFPPRGERGYAASAVETFPWPVVAGYEDVHRWMDQGQAVHAAWQLKDGAKKGTVPFFAPQVPGNPGCGGPHGRRPGGGLTH